VRTLPLIGISSVQSGAANARCTLGQTRATPQCPPALQVSNTHEIISHRHRLLHPNFGGVSVGPDHPCWG